MIETLLICIAFGIFILYAFIKGIEIGGKLKRDEPIKIETPIKKLKEYKKEKIYEEKQTKIDTENEINLYNIDIYDGTNTGQKDFE